MTTAAGAGHPSSALSLAQVVTVLMYEQMKFDPSDPWRRDADRLVLSEGHAVPIVYAAYADLGGQVGASPRDSRPLTIEDLDSLRALDSVLDGHPNPAEGFPFFDAATGSLGMGLSVAAGLALSARLENSARRFYCLIGDGESREGQIWEAADFIADYSLDNVCLMINCNGAGQAGPVSALQNADALSRKLAAFGWTCTTVDGHNVTEVQGALKGFDTATGPYAVLCRTIKGWGVQQMQGVNFHGKPLKTTELDTAYADLDALRQDANGTRLAAPTMAAIERQTPGPAIQLPALETVLSASGYGDAFEERRLATRRGYGAALAALGTADSRVVALDGDVGNSTFAEIFAQQHPARFFEGRIAEQNLVSAAAGFAAGGMVPFVSSFAKFIARAYDQVELAAITRANINIVGSHSGLGPASDGPSQMALADVAFFRTLADVDAGGGTPACRLFQPADAVAACRLTELMANTPGMCYMRTHRPDVPFLYDVDERFSLDGFKVLREGSQMTLIASGYMVHEAIRAADALEQRGISCTILDIYALPFDTASILNIAAHTHHRILTLEENYGGGIGSAIAEAAAATGEFCVDSMVVRRIPKSARTPEELISHLGLSTAHVCDRVADAVQPQRA
jgi:transketolase